MRARALAILALLVAAPLEAQPRDALDWRAAPNALSLELAAVPSQGAVTFVWHVADGAGRVTCRLDADGDGEFDHVVEDCAGAKTLTHRYERSGIYFPAIAATGEDGRAGFARAEVAVALE